MTNGTKKSANITSKINDVVDDAFYSLPYVEKLKKTEIPVIPAAIGGGFFLPHALDDSDEELSPTTRGLNRAKSLGETPMTDPFHSFVRNQRRKHGSARNLSDIAGKGTDALDDVLEKLLYNVKEVDPKRVEEIENRGNVVSRGDRMILEEWEPRDLMNDPLPQEEIDSLLASENAKFLDQEGARKHFLTKKKTDVTDDLTEQRELSVPKALGVGLGGGAGAVGLDAAFGEPDNPLEYKLHQMLYSPESRVQAEDVMAKNIAQGRGRGAADILTRDMSRQHAEARRQELAPVQMDQFNRAVETDEYLQDATPEEKEMLGRAFSSMQRFAPELAQDEFAVRNYLRESLMSANGPDYATISNLARANRDITGER